MLRKHKDHVSSKETQRIVKLAEPRPPCGDAFPGTLTFCHFAQNSKSIEETDSPTEVACLFFDKKNWASLSRYYQLYPLRLVESPEEKSSGNIPRGKRMDIRRRVSHQAPIPNCEPGLEFRPKQEMISHKHCSYRSSASCSTKG